MKLEVKNISQIYSKKTPFERRAINDVSLTIEGNEFIGLIGHTGSGKSTLIQHFNGLIKPAQGSVLIDGEDIHSSKEALRRSRSRVGLVFQYPEYQLFEETVYKDIAFGPKNMKLSDEEIDRRVRSSLKFVGLSEDILERSPFEISGGQKRRVAIAGVIAMEPELLILDEPTAGLDPKGSAEIMDFISGYVDENHSVLFVSHSMNDIAKYAKRVLVMNDAELIMDGGVPEIFSRAERLKEIGLDVPQITEIFIRLRALGYPLPTDVYTGKYALKRILEYKGVSFDA